MTITRLNKVGDAIDLMQTVRAHVVRTLPEMGQEWAVETIVFHEAKCRAAIADYMAGVPATCDPEARASIERNLLGRAGMETL